MKPWADARLFAQFWALSFLIVGCVTKPTLPSVDLSAPSWTVMERAVVWRPRSGAPELLGELIVAAQTAGSRWIQFSKQGLPVVTAYIAPNGWQISSALRSDLASGDLPPPSRVLWFQLRELPPVQTPQKPWRLTSGGGVWRMLNDRTGESLEGALD